MSRTQNNFNFRPAASRSITPVLGPLAMAVGLMCSGLSCAQSVPTGAYQIYNQASNLPLVDAGWALGNGYSVEQGNDDQGADTHWIITPVGGGLYKIINQLSGLALVDAGYAKGNGYTIGQWTYDAGADALWQLNPVGSGYYQFVNKASGLSLVDAGYVRGPAHSIGQWAYDSGADAKWLLKSSSGGSNYMTYQLSGCNREPYGVVYNYNTATSTINAQLQQMYANGQRRLKIPIFFGHGLNTGTVMDSTGGTLAPQFLTNIKNLLAEIKQIGYQEVEVGFFAQGQNAVQNNTTNWSTWNAPIYQENWSVISKIHPIVAAAGMPYRIDLFNEAIPTKGLNNYAVSLQFTQKLWNDYASTFGTSDTIGFSIIPTWDRFQEIPNVYGPSAYGSHGAPSVFELHIYETTGLSQDASDWSDDLGGLGYTQPWIIGEAYYNDPIEPGQLLSSIQFSTQPILYVMQWPLSSQPSQQNCPVTPPPSLFSNYLNDGF